MKQAQMEIAQESYGIENDSIQVDKIVLGPGEKYLPEPPDHLVTSIQMYGVLEPVLIDANNVLIEGRRRVASCVKLGIEEVPCRVIVSGSGNGGLDHITASRIALTSHATRGNSVLVELQAIEQLMEAGYSEPQIIAVTGLHVSTFRRRLQLRNLVPDLRGRFEAGDIAVTVAESIAKLDTDTQRRLIDVAGDDKITGPMVREVRARRSEEAYEALDIPGFDQIPTLDDEAHDTAVVRRSVLVQLQDALDAGDVTRAQGLLALMLPKDPCQAEDGGEG